MRIMATGIRMQFRPDVPVEPNDPMIDIRAAMFRTDADNNSEGDWFSDQSLTFWEAIGGYTQASAWTAGVEENSGTMKPGTFAFFTVLDRDIFEPERHVQEAKVVKTFVGGEEA